MVLPGLEKRVEKLLIAYCEGRIPPDLRDQIRIKFTIRSNEVSLVESRPHWKGAAASGLP